MAWTAESLAESKLTVLKARASGLWARFRSAAATLKCAAVGLDATTFKGEPLTPDGVDALFPERYGKPPGPCTHPCHFYRGLDQPCPRCGERLDTTVTGPKPTADAEIELRSGIAPPPAAVEGAESVAGALEDRLVEATADEVATHLEAAGVLPRPTAHLGGGEEMTITLEDDLHGLPAITPAQYDAYEAIAPRLWGRSGCVFRIKNFPAPRPSAQAFGEGIRQWVSPGREIRVRRDGDDFLAVVSRDGGSREDEYR